MADPVFEPQPADERAAAMIRGLRQCDHWFAMLPFSDEELAKLPEVVEEAERVKRLGQAYHDTLLEMLGADGEPRPIEYEGRVYSLKDGRVTCRKGRSS